VIRQALLAVGLAGLAGCASGSAAPEALHQVIARCLDTDDPRYCARCSAPQAGYCQLGYPCSRTTEVWAANQEYVAVRDIKMCGCPAGFVHGLALPRFTVTGAEDPRRPDGIWRFAWDAARGHIGEESEIALAVNPPRLRTEDQLHVHLVRPLPGARGRVSALGPIRVERLEEVWAAAAEHAASRQMPSYGVIVLPAAEGGWLVAAVDGSPETSFTRSRCTS
jgi:CDP-diacylglycerol pyrophosphatase